MDTRVIASLAISAVALSAVAGSTAASVEPRPSALNASAASSPAAPVARVASDDDALSLISRLERFELATLNVPDDRPMEFNVRVPIDGVEREVRLTREAVWTPATRFFVQRADGTSEQIEPPPPNTYRGSVVGLPEASVTGGLKRDGLHILVRRPDGETLEVAPLVGLGVHAVYRSRDERQAPMTCGVGPTDEPVALPDAGDPLGEPDGAVDEAPPMGDPLEGIGSSTHVAELLVECDVEFRNDAGGFLDAIEEMGIAVMNANEAFERDTNITHVISTVRVWDGDPDPYTTGDANVLLEQFRAQMSQYPTDWFDLGVLFTGRNLFTQAGPSIAGLAYVGQVCQVSTGLASGILERRSNDNSQAMLLAHELGHIWNAEHCDEAPCSGQPSPCHAMCSQLNGCDGDLAFGPCAQSRIIEFRNSLACLEPGTNGVQWVRWRSCGFACPENGDIDAPHNTLAEAVDESASGGTIILFPGSSQQAGGDETFPLVIDKAMTIRALANGEAVIGQ